MNPQPVQVLDDLTLIANRQVIARLQPCEALDMAEVLVRLGMRAILREEGADALLYADPTRAAN